MSDRSSGTDGEGSPHAVARTICHDLLLRFRREARDTFAPEANDSETGSFPDDTPIDRMDQPPDPE